MYISLACQLLFSYQVFFFFLSLIPTIVLGSHEIVNTAGMSSGRNLPVNFQGSPVSAGPTEGGLISVQYNLFPSANEPNEPGSGSPKYVYSPYWLYKLYSSPY